MFNINLSKFSVSELKKYTKFIFVFLIIIFLVAAYFFWWPKYAEFRQSSVDLDVESEKVKKKKDYIFELENKVNILEDYEEELLKISSALPLEYSASSLFSFIQKTASENGLILNDAGFGGSNYSVQTVEEGSIQIDKIGITVTVTGNYASFKNFLDSVYKNSRLVEISSISIDYAEQEEEQEGLADLFDFSLHVYANYYKK